MRRAMSDASVERARAGLSKAAVIDVRPASLVV